MGHLLAQLDGYLDQGLVSARQHRVICDFYESYRKVAAFLPEPKKLEENFQLFLKLTLEQMQKPHAFSIFHRSLRQPFDYYQFGLDFIRPFIDFERSRVFGLEALQSIQSQLMKGDNVILLANHQTEPDPQIISLLLEKIDPKLGADMIFVAGHRVIEDPVAIPMSLGRNLLCIYSKKHISHPLEQKREKVLHNQRTLKKMQELLNEGGCCIYVAPSGGRDRVDANGAVQVAPFDPQSLELFWLLGQQAKHPTHFYPLALQTYDLMPPPQHVEKELGERRVVHHTPVFLAFGPEADMEQFSGDEKLDKKAKRNKRAEFIWQLVCQSYGGFPKKR